MRARGAAAVALGGGRERDALGLARLEEVEEHLELPRAERLLLEPLLEVGAELLPRAAQLEPLVVLLHDLLESLGVDPHEGLQPPERAVRVEVDALRLLLRLEPLLERLPLLLERELRHARLRLLREARARRRAAHPPRRHLERRLHLGAPLEERLVHLLELVLERLEELGVHLLPVRALLLELLQDDLEALVVDVVVLPAGRFVLLEVLAEFHGERRARRARRRRARRRDERFRACLVVFTAWSSHLWAGTREARRAARRPRC